ncbi:PREDICTED: uncharacterized protein LOC104595096 [Nelumbo nucifera]|uniref:Uncharacterized protein LOC104595096 n=1 Tax=Nelumbo nucifera TaxID=4432 RepID=A0A1U7ZZ42_NELNU|nr:PREDICTED: uncharacterized protein LOC104595096 [Nelumbo nucifera]
MNPVMSRRSGRDKRSSMFMLRLIMGKLQRRLSVLHRRRPLDEGDDDEQVDEVGSEMDVPEDVKEGQFVVFAADAGNLTRFIVELGILNDPDFLKLLQQAEEEFGFEQKGALMVPCRPDDLQKILGGKKEGSSAAAGWNYCESTTLHD